MQEKFNFSTDQMLTIGACSLFVGGKKADDASITPKDFILSGSNKVAGVFKLKSPLFTRKKNLFSFMNVTITLNRVTNPEFFFYWNAAKSPAGYQFRINEIVLYVRRQKVKENYQQYLEAILDSGKFLRYHFKECRVFTKTYSGFGTELIEDDLFHGIQPSFIAFGFVKNKAFSGDKALDPFHFSTVGNTIQEVCLFVNGILYPRQPLKMNFETKDTFEAYFALMSSFQSTENPDPPMISKEEFDEGRTTIFAFNLAVDQNQSSNALSSYNQPASIRLQVKFKPTTTTENYTLVVLYEMNSVMSFNKTRQLLYQAR